MDNKVTKKRINDHLEYDWYKYLIILIAAIAVCWYGFSQINHTRDFEDVTFFVSCYSSEDNDFEERMKREMESSKYDSAKYGENVMRSITFESQDPLGSNYGTMLQTHGFISSDILILGESLMETVGNGYVELTDELLKNYLLPEGMQIDDLEYFETDSGIRAGIKVSDFSKMKGAGCAFQTDWRTIEKYKEKYGELEEDKQPDDTFYLMINPKSLNIGKFGGKSKDENAQALYLINRFISYCK